jgi:DNA-binding HxlR family transcriptional regulator
MPTYTPDVFNEACPSQKVLSRVADKWAALIICALHDQKVMRNGELLRRIGGINQKMLTQTLRNLEHDGLVARATYGSVPPRVEYQLTALGEGVYKPLFEICRWTQDHLEELKQIWGDHKGPGDRQAVARQDRSPEEQQTRSPDRSAAGSTVTEDTRLQ